MSVRRVREAVKWITTSTTRSGLFKDLAKLYKVDTSKDLCLDVPTEWNSTYLMLEVALQYERVMEGFKLLSPKVVRDLNEVQDDDLTVGVPEVHDWLAIKRMFGYLRKFHRLILLVSDNKSVTVHSFFKKMCSIFSMIIRLEGDEDDAVKNLAMKMETELGKSYKEDGTCALMSKDDNRANELVEELNKSINDLFDLYKKEMTPISDQTSPPLPTIQGSCSHIEVSDDDEEDDSEITRYFKDEQYKMKCRELNQFDILQWWSRNISCYPALSAMARDIMAIPVSSVPSEAAFNTEGRVLSEFRSSLIPQMIEALICAEDWLKFGSGNDFPEDEEEEGK
ncbi:zinc finger BED domain-containing protein RICESLEEPER 2-like [Salvia splendens]|uniref:zinc finger BED domain-containing protein RICESLEEPER 2-like n=1 Tax=Salvia splendens TaxID=180675 RepID=UPI001C267C9C|nr:zinc finger BED domain-containing protein RICESLEEPER 2-like [Salvia splendens]